MNINTENLCWVKSKLLDLKINYPSTTWYVFGSILNPTQPCSDIDLLIIYDRENSLCQIKQSLKDIEMERPLDLIFMTVEEEQELNFIKSEGCVKLIP
ncbi:MAG: nucleotidyltransferase domain-containing protein [Candidatus Caenarcaniphilales bacterium]|nr:nucleotidyltransferase domain-containing protein [Candidatus Caenarcaniphilales bacterium]